MVHFWKRRNEDDGMAGKIEKRVVQYQRGRMKRVTGSWDSTDDCKETVSN